MGSGRRFVAGIHDLIGPRVTCRHRKHDERARNSRGAAYWNIEVTATDSDGKADYETDCEFHSLPPNTRQTLPAG